MQGRILPLAIIGAVGLISSPATSAAIGDWDASFGENGVFARPASSTFLVALDDGRFVYDAVGGYARSDINGRPDLSFGSQGIAPLPGGFTTVHALKRLRDHRTLLAGVARSSSGQLTSALVMLRADGAVDTSFGSQGSLEISPMPELASQQWIVDDLEEQPDGKLLVLRAIYRGGYGAQQVDLWRFLPAGIADTTFGVSGGMPNFPDMAYFWTSGFLGLRLNGDIEIYDGDGDTEVLRGAMPEISRLGPSYVWDIEQLLDDGSMLVSDTSSNSGRIARLRADGTLDTAFGGQGTGFLALNSRDYGYSAGNLLASPGKDLLYVQTYDSAGPTSEITRHLLVGTDVGALDARFGQSGRAYFPDSIHPRLVAAQPDGSVILKIAARYIRLLGTPTRSPGLVVYATQDSVVVDETAGELVVRIQRMAGDAPTSVAYATVSRSQGGSTATADADYRPVSGLLEWAEGDRSPRTIRIPLLSDTVYDPAEQFAIELTPVSGGALIPLRGLPVTIHESAISSSPTGINPAAPVPTVDDSGGGTTDATTLLLLGGFAAFAASRRGRSREHRADR
jgi:uncharacterized delta-60 repeat protein